MKSPARSIHPLRPLSNFRYTPSLIELSLLASISASCTGHAQLSLIPLNYTQLAPNSRLSIDFSPQACYWWQNDQGNLALAMEFKGFSIAGDITRNSMELSLVMDTPPPNTQQDYKANRDTARAIWHRGGWHLRLRARRGTLRVERVSQDTLTGMFRLNCSSEKFWILTGWQRQAAVLFQGKFTAVRNKARGLEILVRTEADHARGVDKGKTTFEPGS